VLAAAAGLPERRAAGVTAARKGSYSNHESCHFLEDHDAADRVTQKALIMMCAFRRAPGQPPPAVVGSAGPGPHRAARSRSRNENLKPEDPL
jgi:hypothetical protein